MPRFSNPIDVSQDLADAPSHAAQTEQGLGAALTAERQARLEAERLLAEKEEMLARNEVLMREVDHRVRNSLQLVASMLSLQARRAPDTAAAKVIEEAQRRIVSIAAVHEQLYRASDTDLVDMRVFLEGLCQSLATNRPANIGAIRVKAEPVMLVSKRAMKIGLLVGELVTNSFKHGYPDGREGMVEVALSQTGERLQLVVADNGVGLPAGFRSNDSKGLGMRLIRSIMDQFDAVLTAGDGPGARFVIDMPAPQTPQDSLRSL